MHSRSSFFTFSLFVSVLDSVWIYVIEVLHATMHSSIIKSFRLLTRKHQAPSRKFFTGADHSAMDGGDDLQTNAGCEECHHTQNHWHRDARNSILYHFQSTACNRPRAHDYVIPITLFPGFYTKTGTNSTLAA